MNSPSEKLAQKILERLIQEKLLSKSEAKRMLPRLVDGSLQPGDWRLAIEISMVRKTKQ